jgi:hypothetical protein
MAADTEFKFVRRFHAGIESAPEDDAGKKTHYEQSQQRVFRAWLFQKIPRTFQNSIFIIHKSLRLKILSKFASGK